MHPILRRNQRQTQDETSAACIGLEHQVTRVRPRDRPRHSQTEAGAVAAGGEKRFKNARLLFRGNPGAIVMEAHFERLICGQGRDFDSAGSAARQRGVFNQVERDTDQSRLIGVHRGRAMVPPELNPEILERQRLCNRALKRSEQAVYRHGLYLQLPASGEQQHLVDQALELLQRFHRTVDAALARRSVGSPAQVTDGKQCGRERRADLMRHRRGHFGFGRKTLVMRQLILQASGFGHIFQEQDLPRLTSQRLGCDIDEASVRQRDIVSIIPARRESTLHHSLPGFARGDRAEQVLRHQIAFLHPSVLVNHDDPARQRIEQTAQPCRQTLFFAELARLANGLPATTTSDLIRLRNAIDARLAAKVEGTDEEPAEGPTVAEIKAWSDAEVSAVREFLASTASLPAVLRAWASHLG